MHVRLRESVVNARRVNSVSADIYRPALAAAEREPCLTAGNLRAEREAPHAALELVEHTEAAAAIRSRRPERLPAATVMHEQVHDRALLRDRSLNRAGQHDRPFRAGMHR